MQDVRRMSSKEGSLDHINSMTRHYKIKCSPFIPLTDLCFSAESLSTLVQFIHLSTSLKIPSCSKSGSCICNSSWKAFSTSSYSVGWATCEALLQQSRQMICCVLLCCKLYLILKKMLLLFENILFNFFFHYSNFIA